MDIVALLGTVSGLVPTAVSLIQVFQGLTGQTNGSQSILNLVAQLTPIVTDLVGRIETIRTQTQDQYPEVWASVRTDWMETLAKWNGLQTPA